MKPLVSAWYAQCWVDAGGKRAQRACELRAISNGMVTPTLFPWRPVIVRSRTPMVVFPNCVRNRLETCKAVRRGFGSEALCADVACLAWGPANERSDFSCSGRSGEILCSLKPFLQKRLGDGQTVVEIT